MIRVLATSLSGSEHIIIGKVVDKQSVPFTSETDAREHLTRIGWTNQRFEVDRTTDEHGIIRTSWDDQSVTEHKEGHSVFTYLRGGPKTGKKLSKSDQNGIG